MRVLWKERYHSFVALQLPLSLVGKSRRWLRSDLFDVVERNFARTRTGSARLDNGKSNSRQDLFICKLSQLYRDIRGYIMILGVQMSMVVVITTTNHAVIVTMHPCMFPEVLRVISHCMRKKKILNFASSAQIQSAAAQPCFDILTQALIYATSNVPLIWTYCCRNRTSTTKADELYCPTAALLAISQRTWQRRLCPFINASQPFRLVSTSFLLSPGS